MPKITVEINDTLDDMIEEVKDGVRELLIEYFEENKEPPEDLGVLDYSGSVHEMIDSAVPVYYQELGDLDYLHGDDIEQAYQDSGLGEVQDRWQRIQWGIYELLNREAYEYFDSEADDLFEEWQENHRANILQTLKPGDDI